MENNETPKPETPESVVETKSEISSGDAALGLLCLGLLLILACKSVK